MFNWDLGKWNLDKSFERKLLERKLLGCHLQKHSNDKLINMNCVPHKLAITVLWSVLVKIIPFYSTFLYLSDYYATTPCKNTATA